MKESRLEYDAGALDVPSRSFYRVPVVQYPLSSAKIEPSSAKIEPKRLRSGAIQPVDEQSTIVLCASQGAKDSSIPVRRTGTPGDAWLERIWKGKRQRSDRAMKLPRSAEDPLQRSKLSSTQQRDAEAITRHKSPVRMNERHNQITISYQREEVSANIVSSERQELFKGSKRASTKVSTHTTLRDLLPIDEDLVHVDHESVPGFSHPSPLQQKSSRPNQRKELPMGSPPETWLSPRPPRPSLYSTHELHYKKNQKNAEKMRKRTYLPYRQNLLACFGFCTKTH